MSEKRIVKGLFGALQADADGVEWETDSSELKQEIENERLISLAHHAMQRLSEDPRLAALFLTWRNHWGSPPNSPFKQTMQSAPWLFIWRLGAYARLVATEKMQLLKCIY